MHRLIQPIDIAQRLLVVFVLFNAAQCSAVERPNVIVVMTDDQGYGEFSCHGNPITETPHIDRLASQSVRLTDFHVAPMCTPTRGQLMTGLDAFRNSAINVSSGRTLLRADLPTMADVFQKAGYRTGLFGKWHLGDNYPFRPEDRGFDEAIWFPSSHINSVPDFWDNDYFDDTYIHNTKRQKYEGYCTDIFFHEAAEWVTKSSEQPFFAYIALNAAHWPWFVPDHYRDRIRQSIAKNPDVVAHLPPAKVESLVSFLAMGANIDDNVGRLDKVLLDNNLFDNTVVVFLTDNGSTMGQDYFNAGMKGKKTQLWEGGHRVPCFIRWPAGRLGLPRDVDLLTHVQDLLPTLADVAQIEDVPNQLDGVSLVPALQDDPQAKKQLSDRMLVINYSRMPGFKVKYTKGNPAIPAKDGAGVMWQKWRLLENRELYNVAEDPHQDRDVADQHPDVVAKLRGHLNDWWNSVRDDVNSPQRVIIGNDAENPMLLTACEWLDVFVDQQKQIRRGDRKNGTWHLNVDQPGRYRFELRRWPRESGLQLTAGLAETQVTDGVYERGTSLPIASARLQVGEQSTEATQAEDHQSFHVTLPLEPGPTTLTATFLDNDGKPICGAYYVYVERE